MTDETWDITMLDLAKEWKNVNMFPEESFQHDINLGKVAEMLERQDSSQQVAMDMCDDNTPLVLPTGSLKEKYTKLVETNKQLHCTHANTCQGFRKTINEVKEKNVYLRAMLQKMKENGVGTSATMVSTYPYSTLFLTLLLLQNVNPHQAVCNTASRSAMEKKYLTLRGVLKTWRDDTCFHNFISDEFVDVDSNLASGRTLSHRGEGTTPLERTNSTQAISVVSDDIDDEFSGFNQRDDQSGDYAPITPVVNEFPEKSTRFFALPADKNSSKEHRALKKNADICKVILNPSFDPTGTKNFTGANIKSVGFSKRLAGLQKEVGGANRRQEEARVEYTQQKLALVDLSTKCTMLLKALRLRGLNELSNPSFPNGNNEQENGIDMLNYTESSVAEVRNTNLNLNPNSNPNPN